MLISVSLVYLLLKFRLLAILFSSPLRDWIFQQVIIQPEPFADKY